ncbi:MAG: MarR family transcriptional regulator, lower aerobic nicotinate degradation pathway regulator [Kribbellaceae bacterium]|nr:MarR family transcriptional regulator, lower aerobic nicotinate degradation pathway regulator [Kribbellaceae bacterium]
MVARDNRAIEPTEFELSAMIGHLLRTCQQVHVAIWADIFPGGLTSPQFAVLHALAHEGPLTQVALRSKVRLDRSTTADVVRRLVARRLVTQVRDPEDGRRKVVRLTAAGRALYAEGTVRATQVNEAMLAGLSASDRAQLLALLASLLEHHKGLLDYREN